MSRKPRTGAAREAARRASQPARPARTAAASTGPATDRRPAEVPPAPTPAAPDPAAGLELVARRLAALDRRRVQLLADRDELVATGRAAGVSWRALAAAAGTTRQALMSRHAGEGSRT